MSHPSRLRPNKIATPPNADNISRNKVLYMRDNMTAVRRPNGRKLVA